jgi:hypothetical protein
MSAPPAPSRARPPREAEARRPCVVIGIERRGHRQRGIPTVLADRMKERIQQPDVAAMRRSARGQPGRPRPADRRGAARKQTKRVIVVMHRTAAVLPSAQPPQHPAFGQVSTTVGECGRSTAEPGNHFRFAGQADTVARCRGSIPSPTRGPRRGLRAYGAHRRSGCTVRRPSGPADQSGAFARPARLSPAARPPEAPT